MAKRKALKLNKQSTSVYEAFCSGFSILLLALLLMPAMGTAQAVPVGKPHHILVLIDRSGSVHFDAKKTLKVIVPEINSMRVAGEILGVSYIHSQTPANPQCISIKTTLPANYASSGGATQQNMTLAYEEQIQEELSKMKTELRKQLAEPADKNVRPFSDIWGSLATMDTFFGNASASDNCEVFIISDMVESMPGKGRRDFDKTPPPNDATVLKQMAAVDMPKIRSIYGLKSKTPLAKIDHLTVLFPASGLQYAQNNAMTQYWINVFELLGLPRQKILFQ